MNGNDAKVLAAIVKLLFWDERENPPDPFSDKALLRIMRIGTWDHIQCMEAQVSCKKLRNVVKNAEMGDLDPKSLNFWILRLDLCPQKFESVTNLHLNILPEVQQEFWHALKSIDLEGFVLYRGTALALRLGHRISVDFDFFAANEFSPSQLRKKHPYLAERTIHILEEEPNVYSILCSSPKMNDQVKFSFFGNLDFGQIEKPFVCKDNSVRIASLKDLFATKLAATFNRIAKKDYQDIAAILRHGLSLEEGISYFQAIHPNANPAIVGKTLSWFEGGDLDELGNEDKELLSRSASKLGKIPSTPTIVSDIE